MAAALMSFVIAVNAEPDRHPRPIQVTSDRFYERPSRRSRRLGAVTSSAVEQAADQASSRVSAIATTVWPQLAAQTDQRPFCPPW